MVTHLNYFEVNDKRYRQTSGLAMGSPCSGTVANPSMARREKAFVHRESILCYTRYIDEIFVLLEPSSVIEVRKLLGESSTAVAPLRIQWNVSDKHAVYLDIEIAAPRLFGNPTFKPYRKLNTQHAYLPWTSANRVHVKKGIVIGEVSRLALLWSKEHSFKTEVEVFGAMLLRHT